MINLSYLHTLRNCNWIMRDSDSIVSLICWKDLTAACHCLALVPNVSWNKIYKITQRKRFWKHNHSLLLWICDSFYLQKSGNIFLRLDSVFLRFCIFVILHALLMLLQQQALGQHWKKYLYFCQFKAILFLQCYISLNQK